MLLGAGLPQLVSAVVLLEVSAAERFLPVFPFAFVAVAVVLETARRQVAASACLMLLLKQHGDIQPGAAPTKARGSLDSGAAKNAGAEKRRSEWRSCVLSYI